MIVLGTDHVSEIQVNSKLGARLLGLIDASQDRAVATTIITSEEQFRGRLAGLRHPNSGLDQVVAYAKFAYLITFFNTWTVLPFNQASANHFDGLKKQKVRIGSMDLKIAAIVLAHDATLLSANLRDFQQVTGLRVEDWLHD